jgi:hypothetical protein
VNGSGALDPADIAADEFQRRIAHQHAGEQARLAENLKTIADPSTSPPRASRSIHDARAAIAPQRR